MKKLFITILICIISLEVFASNPNIILFGLPGAGKGTLSQKLIENNNYAHICPGNLLRAEVRNQTEFGNSIKPIVDKGEYLPEELLFNFLKGKIKQANINHFPLILDGYPRSAESVKLIDALFQDLNIKKNTLILHLKTDPQILMDRVLNRAVCNKCNKVYTAKTTSCKKCNIALAKRPQDTAEVLKKRINHYLEVTDPVLKSFNERGYKIFEIDGNGSEGKVLSQVSVYVNAPVQAKYPVRLK
jgi:adenylate kinase